MSKRALLVFVALLAIGVAINVATQVYNWRLKNPQLPKPFGSDFQPSAEGEQLELAAREFATAEITEADARKWLEQNRFHIGGYTCYIPPSTVQQRETKMIVGKRKLRSKASPEGECWLEVSFGFFQNPIEFEKLWVGQTPYHPAAEDDAWSE